MTMFNGLDKIDWPQHGSTPGRIRLPYEVGVLARGTFDRMLDVARLLHITVEDYRSPASTWWTWRGMLTLSGTTRDLKFFVRCLKDWSKRS